MSWVAYVDESIRTLDGVYVFAAATLDSADTEAAREAMWALAPRPGQRFHWRDQEPRGRKAAVAAVAELPSLHLVAVGAPVIAHRQERARRQCLEALLFHLEDAGVRQVLLESRNPVLDRRDFDAVAGFRARKVITGAMRVDHARPGDDPLLWAADIVAGAVGAAEGGESAYRALLGHLLTEHRIALR